MVYYSRGVIAMMIRIETVNLQEFTAVVEDMRKALLPEGQSGFYMAEPDMLFVDDKIDNETVGQLDKAVCRFIGDHRILKQWQEVRYGNTRFEW
jgi:hypothetical protein